jgi:hypothetical protein
MLIVLYCIILCIVCIVIALFFIVLCIVYIVIVLFNPFYYSCLLVPELFVLLILLFLLF